MLVLRHWEYLSSKRQDACPFGTYVLVGEVLRLKNKYESVCYCKGSGGTSGQLDSNKWHPALDEVTREASLKQ